ncbi:MAG TPA: type II secretion system F family protein [Bryobacteraceae bacterium]|nr:type II secretion system F family protein [Bryobacteraceae bacterium]
MSIVLIVAFFIVLMTAIAAFGYQRYARPGQVYERLGEPVIEAPTAGTPVDPDVNKPREFKIIQRVGEILPVSTDESSMTRRMLNYAGYRSDNAVKIYHGIRLLSTLLLAIFGLAFRNKISPNPALHIIFPAAMALGGYILPNFMLEKKIKKRQTNLRLALPDALDLMVIAVEAGLGLDQAINYVATELRNAHPKLTDEFQLVNLEIRAGKRRSDALRNLGDRTGESELRKLTAILIQNDRFGTSVAESLRQHSEYLRVRRRQEAEERAAKVGVKLVFPIFFFILPAMMLVCAGPGVLGVVKYLLPLMKGF